MPRANRHTIPGQVWHITHRCHEKKWLLKFSRDRKRWLYWLFESRQRYHLTVLNYVVTSNHIHLLVKDNGHGEIARSMQLIAGRTAQEYNNRKQRRGAFWEDRYHATAVQTDAHLHRCITYIDLNMVRAGKVGHPEMWPHGGFAELMNPRDRYTYIDYEALLYLLSMSTFEQLQRARTAWVNAQISSGEMSRRAEWTESVAVGGEKYINSMLSSVQQTNRGRKVQRAQDCFVLRESAQTYSAIFA